MLKGLTKCILTILYFEIPFLTRGFGFSSEKDIYKTEKNQLKK